MGQATFIEYEVVGKIVPIGDRTRVRREASTYTSLHPSYPNGVSKGTQVVIDLVREYTNTVAAEYVKDGDLWGRVVSVNGVPVSAPAWMAIVYLGGPICTPTYELVMPEPEPEPEPGVKEKIVAMTVVYTYGDGTTETEDFIPRPLP